MLYDPKWEVKTKPTLAGFIAWLETKDPQEGYVWGGLQPCAVHQYFQSLTSDEATAQNLWGTEIAKRLNALAFTFGARNFGSLLEVARLAAAES